MEAIVGLAITIGLIASFIYVIDTLAALKKGQEEVLDRLARLESRHRPE